MAHTPQNLPPEVDCLATLSGVEAAEWNVLARDNPFLSHEFLVALEHSHCIGGMTHWQPHYLVVRDQSDQLVGAMPLYIKSDSRGEFVFDWGWADAFERAGLDYYPKLVAAVPFTPATGPRILTAPSADRAAVASQLLTACFDSAKAINASSVHVLFPEDADRPYLESEHYLLRKSCQFHWHNHAYANFEEFLDTFTSSKRKKVRRERRRIAEAGISFEHLHGVDLSLSDWNAVFEFYSRTFMRRGRPPYLNRAFFDEVSQTLSDRLVVILARYESRPIAAAICFRSNTALYGRYWGSLADFHSLHFETCYYQGIEYCIENGLQLFEPGTQGEHKVSRGFSPIETYSYHKILNPDFHAAVGDFLERETMYVEDYMQEMNDHVPYKENENQV